MNLRTHIICIVTVLAAVACVKVERPAQEQRIPVGFQLASSLQTKDISPVSGGGLIQDGVSSFYCNAWFNQANGGVSRFMDNTEVRPDQAPNPTVWAPWRTYFWPATGSVNFFSYASARPLGTALSSVGESAGTPGTVFTITDYEVHDDDNILIADAVYFATRTNAGASTAVTDTDNINHPTGVPTIFRHLLAQVAMDLRLAVDPSQGHTPTTNTDYEVIIKNITLSGIHNRGTLTLTNSYSGSGYGSQSWTPASDGTQIGWVPTDSPTDYDLTPDAGNTLTLLHGETESSNRIILMGGAVLPQTVSGGAIGISMTLQILSKHGDTIYNIDDDIVVTGTLNNTTPAWYMNQRILYHIGFDPVRTTLSFDPIVADWADVSGGNVSL